LIDGVAVGGDGRAACSLRVQSIEWEIREQQVWQRPCNETPPSPHCTWIVRRRRGRATEENRGKREEIERQGQGARGSEMLIDGVAAGGAGQAACSLLVQPMKWEIRQQKGWQRPCNETPPSSLGRHGGRAAEENRGKREEIEGQGQGARD